MSETMDGLQQAVEMSGSQVMMGEPDCVVWRADHPNCKDCQHELGCSKLAILGIIQLSTMLYTPTNFEDFQKQTNRILELSRMVLEARTVEELHKVPHI